MSGRLSCFFTACVLLSLTISAALAASPEDVPQTAFRWDPQELSESSSPTSGPIPNVYKLSYPLGKPQAIDVDEYGRIYVLDHGRQSFIRFNPDGSLNQMWPEYAHDSIMSMGRDDLSVVSGERIFLSPGYFSWNIRCLAPGGVDIIIPHKGGQGLHIAACEDGRFLVDGREKDWAPGERTEKSEVYLYSADGILQKSWLVPLACCIAVGPDGMVYTSPDDQPVITVTNMDGIPERNIDLSPFLGNGLSGAGQITVDTNGDIYFVNRGFIYRIDKEGRALARWLPYRAPGDHPSLQAFNIITSRNGLIYAIINRTDAQSFGDSSTNLFIYNKCIKEIQVFTPGGQCVARYVCSKPDLETPSSLAVHQDGSYAVIQRTNTMLRIYDTNGKSFTPGPEPVQSHYTIPKPEGGYIVSDGYHLHTVGQEHEPVETIYKIEFDEDPNYMIEQFAVDPTSGDLWGLGGRGILIHLDPQGGLIKRLEPNRDLNFRTWSLGMVIDQNGIIYISNAWGHTIVKVDMDGNIIETIGKEGSGLGELQYPEGLTFDEEERLFVADSGNCRIQVFSPEGKPLGFWGSRGSGDGQLDRPSAIAFGPKNTLWISDTFNDRIVKVSLDDFWKQIKTEIEPEPVPVVREKQPIPRPGSVTVTGIVIAGSEDFLDTVYIEDPDRSWGMRITLPDGVLVYRGECCRMSGILEQKPRAARHLIANTVERVDSHKGVPEELGMANLYVGDGCRGGTHPLDLSNLGMLVRTWGLVTSVDNDNLIFTINDGSYPKDSGLIVYAANLNQPLDELPDVGQYVAVTGVSITWASEDGQLTPGLRVRNQADIQVFNEK